MADEKLNFDTYDSGWETGVIGDVDEAIADADGAAIGTATKNQVAKMGLGASVVEDGDTVTGISIVVRARTTGPNNDILGVELLIGGVVQGARQDSVSLTASFVNYTFSDVAWDVDRTAAEMDGAEVQLHSRQSGMPGAAGHEVDCGDADVVFTPGGEITLVVADADHLNVADNIDLVQANVLAMQDADHLHTADNVVLDIPAGIAFDAVSAPSQGGGNLSWTHTPVGTPRGVLVYVVQEDDIDEISGVTYGGDAMTELADSPLQFTAGEDAAVYVYFLGSGISIGAQTVVVTVTGGLTRDAMAVTVTAAKDTEVHAADVTLVSASQINPSANFALSGVSCFVSEAFFSGDAAETGSTPRTNWTKRFGSNFAVSSNGFMTYDIVGTSDVEIGYLNSAAEDVVLFAVALKEVAALVDAGLVARYYIDEAVSGTGPTALIDAGPNGYDLDSIDYNAGAMAFTEISGNRGLESTTVSQSQNARHPINNTSDAVRDAIHGTTVATLEMVVRIDAGASGRTRVWGINDRGGARGELMFKVDALGNVYVAINDLDSTAEAIDLSSRSVVHVVFDSDESTQADRIRIYVNGALDSSVGFGSIGETITFASDLDLIIFNREDGVYNRSTDGVIFYAALYSSAFTSAQVSQNNTILTADDDSPNGITLVVADADHLHDADLLALIQANVLAIADSDHLHAAENLVLDVGVTLVVADADHLHDADLLALIQANVLAIADSDHLHDADLLALVQANILAMNDSDHLHDAENLVLDVSVNLVVADSDHLHDAENLDLIQANILAIAEAFSLHVAENLDLTQANILAIADADHLHDAENLVLDVSITLVVDDSDHLHTGDNLDLLQANILAIADAFSAHVADNLDLTQANILAIADADHLHDAENLVLTVSIGLVVDDSDHVHTGDNVDLIQAAILAINDAFHDNIADNIDLFSGLTLIVSDAVHQVVSDNLNLFDPLGTLPEGIVFTIDGKNRIFVINTKDRVFVVLPSNRV